MSGKKYSNCAAIWHHDTISSNEFLIQRDLFPLPITTWNVWHTCHFGREPTARSAADLRGNVFDPNSDQEMENSISSTSS